MLTDSFTKVHSIALCERFALPSFRSNCLITECKSTLHVEQEKKAEKEMFQMRHMPKTGVIVCDFIEMIARFLASNAWSLISVDTAHV
jgi:hypothetical protein